MLRYTFIAFSIIVSLQLPAQDSAAYYIKKVSLDISNNFQSFKGVLIQKDSIDETTYSSLILIPGTHENKILYNKWISAYSAWIIDSVSENEGKKIIRKWQKLIESVIESNFEMKKLPPENFLRGYQYGWGFYNENSAISISLHQSALNTKNYSVILSFSKSVTL